MTTSVDVLAVMTRALSACEAHTSRTVFVGGKESFKRISDNYGLPEAISAVAELIEAIGPALYELRDKSEAKKDLIAALSRVKGA